MTLLPPLQFAKWRLQLADNSPEVVRFYVIWIPTLIHLE